MSGPKLPIAIAAGTGKDRAELGTDATEILESINAVMSEEGVLILLDIGSAILSAEIALGFLEESQRAKVRCCGAPFVEGAVAAGVLAALGSSLEEVTQRGPQGPPAQIGTPRCRAREDARTRKSPSPSRRKALFSPPRSSFATRTAFMRVPRPRFIREAARYDCEIEVRNLSNGRGPASAKSMSGLASLEILQGHEIQIAARGPDAETALRALRAAVKAGLGERVDLPGCSTFQRPASPNQGPIGVSGGIAIGQLFFAQAADAEVPTDKVDDTEKEKRETPESHRKGQGSSWQGTRQSLRQSLGKGGSGDFSGAGARP